MDDIKKFRVLGGRVLLRPAKREEKVNNGIIIPDSVSNSDRSATVIRLGDGCKLDLVEGDKVLVDPGRFMDIVINDAAYLIGKEDDISVIL